MADCFAEFIGVTRRRHLLKFKTFLLIMTISRLQKYRYYFIHNNRINFSSFFFFITGSDLIFLGAQKVKDGVPLGKLEY